MSRRLGWLLLLAVTSVASCGHGGGGTGVAIRDARIPMPAGSDAALYFTVVNHGTADRLVAVHTAVTAHAQLHRTVTDGGLVHMEPVTDGLVVPAHENVVFAPGGLHVMLLDAKPMTMGESVPVTLVFDHAGDVTVRATVVAAADAGGDEMSGDGMSGMG